jgi:hypothetical protein
VLLTGSERAAGPVDAPVSTAATGAAPSGAAPSVAALDRAAGNEVSRDMARTPLAAGRPVPVAGLDLTQTGNAATIVAVAKQLGLTRRAMVIAVATAMQESDLRNMASGAVPESLGYPHEGIEVDHDSVGLFQQRSSQGWGSVAELMDPAHSAALFFDRLAGVPGWQSMSVSGAAQAVQRSAFPDAYERHESLAERVVTALA